MPWLVIYLFKASFCLSCVYLFYFLFLRRLTFHHWNRFYLALYSLLAFVLPLIDITPVVNRNGFEDVRLVNAIPAVDYAMTAAQITGMKRADFLSFPDMLSILFFLGVAWMTLRFFVQYLSLQRIKRSAALIRQDDIWLYDVNTFIHPFSFGKDIFINRASHSEEELKKIIQHEFVHVKQQHSIDLVIGELLCILNWYNPFAWLLRKSIRENLEFIADNQVLQSGTNAQQYQYLLLKVIGLPQYSITSHFSFSSLKKRIAMMNKLRSAKYHLVKFLFILPLCALMLLAFRNRYTMLTEKPGSSSLKETPVVNSGVVALDITAIKPAIGVNSAASTPSEKQEHRFITDTTPLRKAVPPAPPPPPLPATDPLLPEAPTAPPLPDIHPLPEGVSSLHIENDKVTIKLKNGRTERYDMSKGDERATFNNKYGFIPEAPKPPAKVKPSAPAKSAIPAKDAPPAKPAKPVQPAKPEAPVKTAESGETTNVIQLPPGTYTVSKDVMDRFLADAMKRGEILIGISNPLDIVIENVRKEDLQIEWGAGQVKFVQGIFYAVPTKTGMSKLVIFKKENDGSKTQLKTLHLNVKRLPDPTINPELYLKIENRKPARPPGLWLSGSLWKPVKDKC